VTTPVTPVTKSKISWLVAKGDNCVRVGMDRKKEEVTSLEKVA
jgi:hypothetical protein